MKEFNNRLGEDMFNNSERDALPAEDRISWYSCPQCYIDILVDEENCHYCGHPLDIWVCSYCDTVQPAEADPCEICGRYIPADEIYLPETNMEERLATGIMGFLIESIVSMIFPRTRR
jgi:hypothetical protein